MSTNQPDATALTENDINWLKCPNISKYVFFFFFQKLQKNKNGKWGASDKQPTARMAPPWFRGGSQRRELQDPLTLETNGQFKFVFHIFEHLSVFSKRAQL